MDLGMDLVKTQSQYLITNLYRWSQKIDFIYQCGPYVLKVAETKEEVIECFKLRHKVFYEELAGVQKATGMDYDIYDNYCDHLIIIDQQTNKIVGTYRLNCSKFGYDFYIASEFEIEDWLDSQNKTVLELGRACIDQNHRRGIVISLLWKGIAEYMRRSNAEILIGCSSVKYESSKTAAMIFKYFEEKGVLSKNLVSPQEDYIIPDFTFWQMCYSEGLAYNQFKEIEDHIPSLLNSYIKSGAKVLSYPAHDKDMKCIDFVTVLDWSDLDERLIKKFG